MRRNLGTGIFFLSIGLLMIVAGVVSAVSDQGGMGTGIAGVIVAIIGIPVFIIGVVLFLKYLLFRLRIRSIRKLLQENGLSDCLYCTGSFGNCGEERGGFPMFPFPFMKRSPVAYVTDFILTGSGIYFGKIKNNTIALDRMSYLAGFELPGYSVRSALGVIMLERDGERAQLFYRDSGVGKQAVIDKLNEMKQGASVADFPMADPFAL